MRYHKSIFYTTYGDYKNCGQFFDYLLSEFEVVAFFDIKSHYSDPAKKSLLILYKLGVPVFEKPFATLPTTPPVFLVPLYHFYYFLNILFALLNLKVRHNTSFDVFITSFSLWSLAGLAGKFLGCCKKVILWSWDYYPIYKDNPYHVIQQLLQPLESLAINLSDHSWYASPSNMHIRTEIKQIKNPADIKHKVVHWGTGGNLDHPIEPNFLKTGILRLVYFGALHSEKGLALVVDSLQELLFVTGKKLEMLIIGRMSPFGLELKTKIAALGYKDYVKFIEFMPADRFAEIAKDCDLGLALFVPEVGGKINYSHYADPAKPRDYLACGLPILTTTVPFIHKDIEKFKAGFVLAEYDVQNLVMSIKQYMVNPSIYTSGAFALSREDRYDVYYSKQFDMVFSK